MSRTEDVALSAWRELPSWAQDSFRERPGRFGSMLAAALRAMAREVDAGPTFELPPSVISELIRERADSLEALDEIPVGDE